VRHRHTVFLYRAVAPSDVVGNVLIDNRVDERGERAFEACVLARMAYENAIPFRMRLYPMRRAEA
jgi:hypothetical protein